MSWLFSQVQVEEYLGGISLDGEQSALSSGKPTPQAYCSPDKMMEVSRLSRYGMTFAPLTEDLGQELLTLYREGFHAKTSQSQEMGTDLTENVQECGEKWHGLLARFDPDSHLWRTVQCSLLEDLNESLQTLPQWGMTVGGELYLLPTLVQTIKEEGYGLSEKIPTPNAWDGKRGPMSKELMETGKHQVSLVTYVKHNPIKWGTPKEQDSRHALWDRGKSNLGEQVSGLHNGGKLSPLWTEWLMGWPIGWTDLKPLGTDKSPSALPLLGDS